MISEDLRALYLLQNLKFKNLKWLEFAPNSIRTEKSALRWISFKLSERPKSKNLPEVWEACFNFLNLKEIEADQKRRFLLGRKKFIRLQVLPNQSRRCMSLRQEYWVRIPDSGVTEPRVLTKLHKEPAFANLCTHRDFGGFHWIQWLRRTESAKRARKSVQK